MRHLQRVFGASVNFHDSRRYLANHEFDSERLVNADMRATRAAGSRWVKCAFDGVHFDSSNFAGATIDRCSFSNCTFPVSVFSGASILETEFSGCDFVQADFSASVVKSSGFSKCRMEYATFFEAVLTDVGFEGSNLSGSILLFASQKGVTYTGADLYDAAFRFSCSFFKDAKFDETQWQMFQSLLSFGKGYTNLHAATMKSVNPKIARLVERRIAEGV